MMNKNGHEAKQVLEILPEFVAIGSESSTGRYRLRQLDGLEVEPDTQVKLTRASRAARNAEEG